MTSQTAALTAKVAATLVVGKAAWFYLSDSGVFLLVSREDDPRGLRFKELLAEARSSDTMAGRAVHGMAAHRPGGFQFLAKVGFPAAMEVLARWTAEHIADHPALGVLRNASYVQLGPDKKPVCVVRAPDAWAAVPIPGSASNASSGTSSSSVTVERVDSSAAFAAAKAVREAIAQETLSALSDYGLAAWIYLASTSKPDEPVLVVVPKATDPGRTKFNELCRKANAAGAIRAGSVVSLARQRRGVLRLTTRIDAAEVVPRIAAWAAMYAKSDAIEALYDCEYRLIDAQNQEVRVEQCPELWDALRGSGAEPATRKPNPPLPLEPSHDPEALAVLDAKTVAVLGQGLQPLWMHVAEGHSEGQVVLLAAQQSADPAAAAFKASVTAARQAGARARGSLSVLAVPKEGRLVLSTKADVPGVVARIARWAEQHAVSTSIRTLFDVQYQLVDADGTPVRTDEAQTRWAALRAQHADEAIPYAQESLAALERGADNYWAYLARTLDPQRPIVVMVDRASDPDGEEFRRVCAQARRWGACTSDLVTGITMQRAQGLEVLGSTAAVDVIARLAQWASHHSEHPGVAALVDARYRATDAQDTVIQVEQNDPVWDAIRMQHHPDRVAPSATATLAALALRADQYWVYVDGTGAHIVAVSKVADPQGMAFRRARQAVVQGGDGGVSAVATRQGDTLQMVGQADVSNVVERLVRWTSRHADNPAARLMVGATYEVHDREGQRIRVERDDDAWSPLHARFEAAEEAAAKTRLAAIAEASQGEPGDTVAVMELAEVMQWHWFWLCVDGDSIHLLLRDAASDPKRRVFEQAVLQVRKTLAAGFREGVGKAAKLGTGVWNFRSRTAFAGATEALAKWVEQWQLDHPRVQDLVGAPYLKISAQGHVEREQRWPSPASAAPPAASTAEAALATPPRPASEQDVESAPQKPSAPTRPVRATPPLAPEITLSVAKPERRAAVPPSPVLEETPQSPAVVAAPSSNASEPALAPSPTPVSTPTPAPPSDLPPAAPTLATLSAPFAMVFAESNEAIAPHGPSSNPRDLVPLAELGAALAAQAEQTAASLERHGLLGKPNATGNLLVSLQAAPALCEAWVASVRGPPFAARNPIVVGLPESLQDLPLDARREGCASAANLYGHLGRVASKLNQYQSYRSSFPPSMRAGFDERVGELVALYAQLNRLVWELSGAASSR